mmetsp:Transcript_32816/g.72495  ORF Transcript_32816/g.72495 Transcript_32816/m.72495 type:complete len:236 (-) Transcript_32816:1871-2578(-)
MTADTPASIVDKVGVHTASIRACRVQRQMPAQHPAPMSYLQPLSTAFSTCSTSAATLLRGHLGSHEHLRGVVKPRRLCPPLLLKLGNLVTLLHGQADVVQPVEQAVLAEGVNVKAVHGATLAGDGLGGQINVQLLPGITVLHQLVNLGAGQLDGQHAVLEAVVVKDVGKARRDDTLDAKVLEGPGGVLAAGAAPKVVGRHDDAAAPVLALVQDEVGPLGAVLKVTQSPEGSHAQT